MMGITTREESVTAAAMVLPVSDSGVGIGEVEATPLALMSMKTPKPRTFAPLAMLCTRKEASVIA